jgi:hypothetical protein
MTATIPRINTEHFCRRNWHADCVPGKGRGVMRLLDEYKQIADGSWLRKVECLACGVQAWVGVNKERRVIVEADD